MSKIISTGIEKLDCILPEKGIPDCSVLSLIGLGDTYRTTMALQISKNIVGDYPESICFIDCNHSLTLSYISNYFKTGKINRFTYNHDLPTDQIRDFINLTKNTSKVIIIDALEAINDPKIYETVLNLSNYIKENNSMLIITLSIPENKFTTLDQSVFLRGSTFVLELRKISLFELGCRVRSKEYNFDEYITLNVINKIILTRETDSKEI